MYTSSRQNSELSTWKPRKQSGLVSPEWNLITYHSQFYLILSIVYRSYLQTPTIRSMLPSYDTGRYLQSLLQSIVQHPTTPEIHMHNRSDHCRVNTVNTYIYAIRQNYDLVAGINHAVCATFIHEWCDVRFNFDSKRQSERIFIIILIAPTVFFCFTNLLQGSLQKNNFHISFSWSCLAWGLNPSLVSCKPSHFLL